MVNSYSFTGGYSYVELVQAPASNTSADAMFTIGSDVNNYYRLYVSGGNLIGQKRISGTKTTLFTTTYNSTNHRFLRIRHDASTGNVTLDTATGSGGTPGSWVQQHSETWNSNVVTTAMFFEVKAGTSQVEANAPGTIIFDNFHVAIPGSGGGSSSSLPAPSKAPIAHPLAPNPHTSVGLIWTYTDPDTGRQWALSGGTYKIKRCSGASCTPTTVIASGLANVVNNAPRVDYQDTGLTANTTYGYRYVANDGADSADSPTVYVTTQRYDATVDSSQHDPIDYGASEPRDYDG